MRRVVLFVYSTRDFPAFLHSDKPASVCYRPKGRNMADVDTRALWLRPTQSEGPKEHCKTRTGRKGCSDRIQRSWTLGPMRHTCQSTPDLATSSSPAPLHSNLHRRILKPCASCSYTLGFRATSQPGVLGFLTLNPLAPVQGLIKLLHWSPVPLSGVQCLWRGLACAKGSSSLPPDSLFAIQKVNQSARS